MTTAAPDEERDGIDVVQTSSDPESQTDGEGTISAMPEHLERPMSRATLTVGQLREQLAQLTPEVEVHIGIYESHRFNVVIGTLPVIASQVSSTPQGSELLLCVVGIS